MAAEEGFDGLVVEELAAVVGRDADDLDGLDAVEEPPEGAKDFVSGDVGELFDEVAAGLALNEHEQSSLAVDAGNDGVHFPVSELGAAGEVGTLFDGEVAGHLEAAAGLGAFPGDGNGLVGQLGGGYAQVAMVDVVVDAPLGWQVGNALFAQPGQGVVGGAVVLDDFDAQELGQGGVHRHGAALVEVSGVDGLLGDFGGVVPDFLVLEEVGTRDETAMDLVVEGAGGQADLACESPQGKTLLPGHPEIAVVGDFNEESHSPCNVLAGRVVDVIGSGHGGLLSWVGWL